MARGAPDVQRSEASLQGFSSSLSTRLRMATLAAAWG
jgi:hypothetical protein